jgi:hypothetical protein
MKEVRTETLWFCSLPIQTEVLFLNVPVRKAPRDLLCSETSASMVFEYFTGESYDPLVLEKNGCDALETMLPCVPEELKCEIREKPPWEVVVGELRKGNPVQVRLLERDTLHTVVARGMIDGHLLVNDPSIGLRLISKEEFDEKVKRAMFCEDKYLNLSDRKY